MNQIVIRPSWYFSGYLVSTFVIGFQFPVVIKLENSNVMMIHIRSPEFLKTAVFVLYEPHYGHFCRILLSQSYLSMYIYVWKLIILQCRCEVRTVTD